MKAFLLGTMLALAPALAGCVGLGEDEPVDPQTVQDGLLPTATVDPERGPVTTRFTFDAGDTSAPKDATYTWSFGDGGTATGTTAEHVFRYDNNAYRVVLTVTVGAASAQTSVIVPVGSGVNARPEGAMTVSSGWVAVGAPVAFDVTASDPDGDPVEVLWFKAVPAGSGGDGHAHSHALSPPAPPATRATSDGEGHEHGSGTQFGLDEPIDADGDSIQLSFDAPGDYRITASIRDVKGARADLPAVVRVSASPPRERINITESDTLVAGTAGQGVSLRLYEYVQPSQNTYIDAARYDFAVRYPGEGVATLTFSGAGGVGPADLDLQVVRADNGQIVATYDTSGPAAGGPGVETGDIRLPVGTYTAYVLAQAGAQIDYTLAIALRLDVPGLGPFTVHSEGHAGDGHTGHDH